jgi:hypothetical protein
LVLNSQFPDLSCSEVSTTRTTFAATERTFILKSRDPRYILAPMQSFADIRAALKWAAPLAIRK